LEQLGFGAYVADILDVASEHKEQLKVCATVVMPYGEFAHIKQGREKKANKLEQSGLSTEQLLEIQEREFRQAAERHN
jgi:down-regulator of transcription 1